MKTNMTEKELELLEALKVFENAADKLVQVWHGQEANDLMHSVKVNNEYPFAQSFDEVALNIWGWREALEKKLARTRNKTGDCIGD